MRPVVSDLAENFYASLGFHRDFDEANDWALLKYVAAWVAPLDPVYELVRERDGMAPWAILYDPDRCPAESLPYTAQYVGIPVTPEMTETQLRNEIREPTGWARGREPAIRIATQRTLTGTQKVVIKSRTPGPGEHYVRVLASECPAPTRTELVVRAAVPAWELLDFDVFEGFTYADLKADVATYAAAKAKYPTYGDILDASL